MLLLLKMKEIHQEDDGISVLNFGTGSTIATITGDVTGRYGAGLFLYSATTSSSFTSPKDINATQNSGNITGEKEGIMINNQGSGSTNVLVAGNIIGTNDEGIYAESGITTDITINQTLGSVAGGTAGIRFNSNGSGSTTINSAGIIKGNSAEAIYVDALANATTTINLNANSDVSSASGVAIKENYSNTTLTMNSGSKLAGKVLLNEGNDSVIIKGTANITAATLFDGGGVSGGGSADVLEVQMVGSIPLALKEPPKASMVLL